MVPIDDDFHRWILQRLHAIKPDKTQWTQAEVNLLLNEMKTSDLMMEKVTELAQHI